jgi:hypothetical protein
MAAPGTTVTSASARLKPAPTLALKIQVAHVPFVPFGLLDAQGKLVQLPAGLKPGVGTRVGDVLLVSDENGKLELAKLRPLATTLLLLPHDGSKGSPKSLPKAAPGAKIKTTLRDLHDGLSIPLDLPAAGAKKLAAFELSIEPAVAHVHRCC